MDDFCRVCGADIPPKVGEMTCPNCDLEGCLHHVGDLHKDEIIEALYEWWVARETLSGDCKDLGISGHTKDSARWGDELSRRSAPLRTMCQEIFKGYPLMRRKETEA